MRASGVARDARLELDLAEPHDAVHAQPVSEMLRQRVGDERRG